MGWTSQAWNPSPRPALSGSQAGRSSTFNWNWTLSVAVTYTEVSAPLTQMTVGSPHTSAISAFYINWGGGYGKAGAGRTIFWMGTSRFWRPRPIFPEAKAAPLVMAKLF